MAATMAAVTVPELLPVLTVFAVDVCPEMDTEMNVLQGVTKTRLQWLKALIPRFVRARQLMNQQHQTALLTFTASQVTWLSDFTNDEAIIERKIGDATTALPSECTEFDLLSVLDSVMQRVNARRQRPHEERYVIQLVLIYGRSNVVPVIDPSRPTIQKHFQDNHLFVDMIYVHEKPEGTQNTMQEVYDSLLTIESQCAMYIAELTRSPKRLGNTMAELLPVPTQRLIQANSFSDPLLKNTANGGNRNLSPASSALISKQS